jgi:transcriptional regulator GlxA family with amidase domain
MIDHLGEAFGIEQVMKHLSVSRRRLETQFQRLMHCSPHDYLCRLRVERVKQLLAEPERIKIRTVAAVCGFSTAARMRLVFRRVVGMTPQEYRRTLLRRGGDNLGFRISDF